MKKMNKKGMGIVSGLLAGAIGLVVLTIVSFLIVDTIWGADLLATSATSATANNTYNTANAAISNMTAGVDNVSGKLPTILLIAAVVVLFGAIAILVQRSRGMTGGGSL